MVRLLRVYDRSTVVVVQGCARKSGLVTVPNPENETVLETKQPTSGSML